MLHVSIAQVLLGAHTLLVQNTKLRSLVSYANTGFYVLHNSRERTFFSCKSYVSKTLCTTTLQISKRNSLEICAPQLTPFRFEHDINIITTTESLQNNTPEYRATKMPIPHQIELLFDLAGDKSQTVSKEANTLITIKILKKTCRKKIKYFIFVKFLEFYRLEILDLFIAAKQSIQYVYDLR